MKVGFESAIYLLGDEFGLQARFNAVRDYVLGDRGDRKVLMLADEDLEYRHELLPPFFTPEVECVAGFRLAIVTVFVDLSESGRHTSRLAQEARNMYGENGWHVFPDNP